MKHKFRNRLIGGELLIGTMITLNSPEIAELMAGVGFDWLFIDAEHAPLSMQDIQRLLQGAGREFPCVIRLPEPSELYIKQALDVGAAGIIAPMVNSAEQTERIVRSAKYAPDGSRGVGISRAHRYGLEFQEYVNSANENVSVIIQVEHIDAVTNIESIVKVKGIDAVFVGPYDLSASLGKLGQVNDPEVTRAIEFVTKTCQSAGLSLGIFGLTASSVLPYVNLGYSLIVAGTDTTMLGKSAEILLAECRQ